jgi:lipoyl(octanoyl) transferase
MSQTSVLIRHLGLVSYLPVYQAMQAFTDTRQPDTLDEFWLLQHFPVYTLGQAGLPEHLLQTGDIPIYHIDRGGQVTYHGPGQLIAYILMDLKRSHWGVKALVEALEQSVIDYLASCSIIAERRVGAPGVYVKQGKIAALGLKIRRSCSYHGLSFNINMDLTPFQGINPCGYQGLEVTQLCDLGINEGVEEVTQKFLPYLFKALKK